MTALILSPFSSLTSILPPPSHQVSASYQAGSSDNISAIVLRLRRR